MPKNKSAFRIPRQLTWLSVTALAAAGHPSRASDHLDTPSVIADPRTDIGDLFAWVAPDGRHLNLAMTIVGHSFSDRVAYAFHIDSGARFPRTKATITLVCRFANLTTADCALGDGDRARGNPNIEAGLVSSAGSFRVFAGLRDDPFFNNVRGTRAMYGAATAALTHGAAYDRAGCPVFNASQTAELGEAWRHTNGGPPTNFLRGWTPDAIVVSVDLSAINRGGPLIAVWASTSGPKGQIDRAARPLTGNALLLTLGSDQAQDEIKERYNLANPQTAQPFADEIAKGIALYDGLDGHCGDSLLIDRKAPPKRRYIPLAEVLADDRLWINTRSVVCTQLLAVERAALNHEAALKSDCGGRTVNYDAVNVYRSLLANGSVVGIDDGVHIDEKTHSLSIFPFLAPPDQLAPAL